MKIAGSWKLAVVLGSVLLPAAGEQEGKSGGELTPAGRVILVDDLKMRQEFERGMTQIIDADEHRKFGELRSELKRKSCDLALPTAGAKAEGAAEVYEQCHRAVVMVSTFFHCPDPDCKRWHSNIATGYLIHPDGIVVTNHHILHSAQSGSKALGVRTLDGGVYAVQEVLASSRNDDVAILRLASERTDFPFLTLGEDLPAGNDVMVISHPDKELYSLSRGLVSRHFIDPNRKCRVMAITADFGKGSSGGPVLDARGTVVGMVASTRSLAYHSMQVVLDEENSCLRKATGEEIRKRHKDPDQNPKNLGFNHQMTFKHCVPVSAIRKLIK